MNKQSNEAATPATITLDGLDRRYFRTQADAEAYATNNSISDYGVRDISNSAHAQFVLEWDPAKNLTETARLLASLVIEQADRNGFDVEADAIRDAVDQFCKLQGITASEAERIAACAEADRQWRAKQGDRADADRKSQGDDFVTHRASWRIALKIAMDFEICVSPGDAKAFWACELEAYDRAFSAYDTDSSLADLSAHRSVWREALEHARDRESDVDDKAYWAHELAAFDRAFQAITVEPGLPESMDAIRGELAALVELDAGDDPIFRRELTGYAGHKAAKELATRKLGSGYG